MIPIFSLNCPLAGPRGDLGGLDIPTISLVRLVSGRINDVEDERMTLSPVRTSTRQFRSPELSAREEQVLRAWLMCDTKQEVADSLFVSVGTVNTHLGRIRSKYERAGRSANTKASLLARALQDGIIRLDEV